MSETVFTIIELLVRLLIVVMVAIVLPAIKQYLDEKNLTQYIEKACKYAEMVYGVGYGSCKLEEVTNLTNKFCRDHGIPATEEQIRALIEAAVYQIKKEVPNG